MIGIRIPEVRLRREMRWALIVGLAGAGIAALASLLPGSAFWDADFFYVAARALLHGRDPYAAVKASTLPTQLFYPLPAVVLFLPFALFPVFIARLLWAAANGAALGWAGARRGSPLLIAALSGAFLQAVILGQMSPLLTASPASPALGVTWAAKPTIGLAIFAAYPSKKHLSWAVGFGLLSLLIMPRWPWEWLAAIKTQLHHAPVTLPGGPILLLALLRWRSPEARLLAALACVPHTTDIYDALPLFLIPQTRWRSYGLAALTLAAAFISRMYLFSLHEELPLGQLLMALWPLTFSLVYLPSLVMVLWPVRKTESGANLKAA